MKRGDTFQSSLMYTPLDFCVMLRSVLSEGSARNLEPRQEQPDQRIDGIARRPFAGQRRPRLIANALVVCESQLPPILNGVPAACVCVSDLTAGSRCSASRRSG